MLLGRFKKYIHLILNVLYQTSVSLPLFENLVLKYMFLFVGHSESVIAASFSPDSKYVATADMNGLVQLWNMDDDSLVWNFEAYEIQVRNHSL